MKSLVAAGAGCAALLALAMLDGPEREVAATARAASDAPSAPLATASYDLA
ncbi:MAG: hypothetical protein ACK6DP_04905 [Gemmatimonas sp.]|uniref:hypothetical protein n=1 Tax=Gemmatimonas sp. TaxID=1962908 RepID=UPI00391EEF43